MINKSLYKKEMIKENFYQMIISLAQVEISKGMNHFK
jgi:hypothetical protein